MFTKKKYSVNNKKYGLHKWELTGPEYENVFVVIMTQLVS